MSQPKRPTKATQKLIDKALLHMRHWHSLRSDIRGRESDEKRMRAKVVRLAKVIANRQDIPFTKISVLAQLEQRARELGPLTPVLGKDL